MWRKNNTNYLFFSKKRHDFELVDEIIEFYYRLILSNMDFYRTVTFAFGGNYPIILQIIVKNRYHEKIEFLELITVIWIDFVPTFQ